jgi:hypothetical protein
MPKHIRIQYEVSEEKDKRIDQLKDLLEFRTKKELLDNALALLDWCANELEEGRRVYSSDRFGKNVKEPIFPFLLARKNIKSTKIFCT